MTMVFIDNVLYPITPHISTLQIKVYALMFVKICELDRHEQNTFLIIQLLFMF
jgi:hypothetical protein